MQRSKQFAYLKLAGTLIFLTVLALGAEVPAQAEPVSFNTFYQFSFTGVGIAATGCDPADPAGPFCISSSGTPTQFAPAPPWTFSSASAVLLTVTDAFEAGDRFQVFDFGVSLGLTSLPVGSGDCGDDPLPCLADPSHSSRVFSLVAGNHSITIVPVLSPSGLGSAYFSASPVPEPTTLMLLGSGVVGLYLQKRSKRRSRTGE